MKMTANDLIMVFDGWIDDWKSWRHVTGQDQYGRDAMLDRMEDLQRRLHEAIREKDEA